MITYSLLGWNMRRGISAPSLKRPRAAARSTCPQKCMSVPTKIVELPRSAPHYARLSRPDSGAWLDSALACRAKAAHRGELFITPRLRGTLHVQARCMNSLAEARPSQRFFHMGSHRYATLARVLHGVKKPQSREGRCSFPLLANGAASADR